MMNFGVFSDNNKENENRLRERFKHIITKNLDVIKGKRILDIAANNGRWTYAALASAASHVTSIEGRQDRIEDAVKFMNELGFNSNQYKTYCGDMYDFLYDHKDDLKIDTVFLLGVYYHVMDHYHLLKGIARLKPQTIIIDSGFVRSFRNSIHVQFEDPRKHLNALTVFKDQTSEPVGFVSLGLMIQMAWNLGYNCRPVVWDPKEIDDKPCVQDYLMGRRFTVRLDYTGSHYDQEWKEYWQPALVKIKPDFDKLFSRSTHDSAMDARAKSPIDHQVFTVLE